MNVTVSFTPSVILQISLGGTVFLPQVPLSAALFICWLITRKQQPVRSKLLSPALFHFFHGVSCLGITVGQLYLTTRPRFIDYSNLVDFFIFMNILTVAISVFLYSFQALRFFSFQHLTRIRLQVIQQQRAIRRLTLLQQGNANNGSASSSPILSLSSPATSPPKTDVKNMQVSFQKARIFHFLGSDVLYYISTIIVVIFWTALSVTGYSFEAVGYYNWSYYFTIPMYVWIAFMAVIIFAFAMVDVVKNRRLLFIKCKWREFLIEKDRLFYRVELISAAFGIACLVLREITNVIAQYAKLPAAPQVTLRAIGGVLTLGIFIALHMTVGGGFVMGVVIYRKFYNWKAATNGTAATGGGNKNIELLNCLRDETGVQAFEAYVKYEYSSENLICYNQILSFKEYPSLHHAKELRDTFFIVGSLLEVNIAQRVRADMLEAISKVEQQKGNNSNNNHAEGSNDEMLSANFFDPVEAAVLENLSDTFQRFRTTNTYKNYIRGKKEKEQELKKLNLL